MKSEKRSFRYYEEQYLSDARADLYRGAFERAVLAYRFAIECALKELILHYGYEDCKIMRSRDLLQLADLLKIHFTKEERHVLNVLTLSYTQLRYPVEIEIDDDLATLSNYDNCVLEFADMIALRMMKLARERSMK